MRHRTIIQTAAICLLSAITASSITLAGGRGGGRGAAPDPNATRNGLRGAAPTLTAPGTPTTKPDNDGFIRRWLLLEPMPANGVSESAFHDLATKEHYPKEFSAIPKDGEKVKINDTELAWHAYDTSQYNVNLYHFSWALNKPTNNACWLVVTVINAPEDMKDVRLAVGSNDASVWWLNGEELIGLYDNRMDTFDDGVSKKITLKKGPNILRAAIANEMGPTDFCARFLDQNDEPVKNITITLTDQAR